MSKIVIGLTGPTGAGKSTISNLALKYGFKTVDCDKLARKTTEKGSVCLKKLAEVFGQDIIETDGSLNRKLLAKKAFVTQEKTKLLNDTIFPFIKELVVNEANTDRVLLDAPTLYESGIDNMCSAVIGVLADEKIRLKRIIERDNIDEESAKLRMSAGKLDDFYKEKTQYIIYNNGDQKDFNTQFEVIINKILKGE